MIALRYTKVLQYDGYNWNIIVLLLERNIHKFPILDDNEKLLEDNSSVTNDSTMIH